MIGFVAALSAWAGEGPLTLWHAYRGDEERALTEAAAAWTQRSGVEVELVGVPFGAFESKLETAIPRGNGPDLFVKAHGPLGKWTRMDLVEPAEPSPEGYREKMIEAVTLSEGTYGYPLAFKTLLLLYDPSRVSSPPETVDELIEVARRETGDGRYGLAYEAATPYYHTAWMHAYGAFTLRDGEVGLGHPGQVQALALAKRLAVDEGIMPPQPTAELVTRLYEDGSATFVISGPWFLAEVDRPVAAAPLPVVDETGRRASGLLSVEAAFVAKLARRADDAHALGRFLAEDPVSLQIREAVGHQAVAWERPPADALQATLVEAAREAELEPVDPRLYAVWEAEGRALRRALRGAASPDEAAHDATEMFEVLTRPLPPPASPGPYLAVIGLTALGLVAWLMAPLGQRDVRGRLWTHRWDYVWVLPAALSMLLLVALPFAVGAAVSLFAHSALEGWSFVGIANFVDILLCRTWPATSPMSFPYALAVTVLWTATNVVLHVAIGVAIAMVLREPWIRLRGVWRALLVLPWAIPNYITALIWKGMFHAQYGAINALLGVLLGRQVTLDWFGHFATSFGANLATNTWLGFPFMMVVTLGALSSVPRDLEDAALLDGAGAWFRFRHVIWPLLAPALLPAVVLGSVWTFNMFNVVYLVSGGEPDASTEILVSEPYRWAFSRGHRYGYAAAYAVLVFLVLLAYSRSINRFVGRRLL